MSTNSDFLQLNFLKIKTQKFSFKVYRKVYNNERREGIFLNLYRNSLPITPNKYSQNIIRKDYWISTQSLNGFEEFTCYEDSNHRLTLRILFEILKRKVESELSSDEFFISPKSFTKRIYFVLKEYKEGRDTIWLEPYYLDPINEFGYLIDFNFKKKIEIAFSREVQRLSLSLDAHFRSNRNFYIDKLNKIRTFFKMYYDKLFPFEFQSTQILLEKNFSELPLNQLKTKEYIFANENKEKSQFRGISKFGPLENIENGVIFIWIYSKEDKLLLIDLIKSLTGELAGVMFKGINKLFNITTMQDEYLFFEGALENSIQKLLEQIQLVKDKNDGVNKIICIFIGDKHDEKAYFSLKYEILNLELPLQVVTKQLIRRRDGLKWSASNIALGIFAKLGGKPWKVKPSHNKAIIFGIGQSHIRKDKGIEKFFAYSICTDSSGIYKRIDVLGNSRFEDDYLKQLKKNVIKVINRYLIDPYDQYILHIPYKIHKNDLNAINQALREVTNNELGFIPDFVVMRVNPNNKFFGYAFTNSLVPYESSYLSLSHYPNKTFLLWFEGLQYHRPTLIKRIPGPILVEFYWSNKKLNKKSQLKYLQDILNLSGANWRGFNAKNLPISIYYSQLVAKFLGKFPQQIDNLENLNTPWFL